MAESTIMSPYFGLEVLLFGEAFQIDSKKGTPGMF